MLITMLTNIMLPFKVLLVSTSVLSAAIMLKYSVPAITYFSVYQVPSIYNGAVSWLRPPYLYLLINFIIVTIVASSKLQSRKDHVSGSPPAQPLDTTAGHVHPQPAAALAVAAKSAQIEYPEAEYKYSDVVRSDSSVYDVKVDRRLDFLECENVDARTSTGYEKTPFLFGAADGVAFSKDGMSNKENECVVAKSTWNPPVNKDSTDYSPSSMKPPASSRFGHRRNIRASPEGGVKTVLGVSKPKRDTLENTWKTITEGRPVPLARHLRKSDTWERDNHSITSASHRHQQEMTPKKMMTKAETFNDRTNTRSQSPGDSGGSGKLRREPSLSQDELNRRVEAFIKKFNEDMRLQRQESLNQYTEMIKRGAH